MMLESCCLTGNKTPTREHHSPVGPSSGPVCAQLERPRNRHPGKLFGKAFYEALSACFRRPWVSAADARGEFSAESAGLIPCAEWTSAWIPAGLSEGQSCHGKAGALGRFNPRAFPGCGH